MVGTETSAVTSGEGALWELSVREMADGLRAREFTAEEVTQAHLERIAACQPAVNALTAVWADAALARARELDRDLADGRPAGPLHGVPFTVKANIDRQGAATTHGVAALREATAAADAPAVAALVSAGAIPLAQSNMPDFAFRWHTDSSAHGVTVNPWNPAVTAGGSSGGAAVACATGMAPFGLGNDTGGSLRQPAQCCGIAGLRPTAGRIADAAATPPTPGLHALTAQGVLARSAADVAAVFPSLLTADPRDPFFAPVPFTADRPSSRRFCVYPGSAPLDPQVAASLERCASALAAAGYERVDAAPPRVATAAALWKAVIGADLRYQWSSLRPLLGAPTLSFLEAFLALSKSLDAGELLAANTERHALAREWSLFMHDVPLVVTPVSSQQPFAVGFDTEPANVQALLGDLECLVAVNLLGLPAAVAPTGFSGGLPQSVQLIGPRYREDLCLSAAVVTEVACGSACDPGRSPLTAERNDSPSRAPAGARDATGWPACHRSG
jgi:amidase